MSGSDDEGITYEKKFKRGPPEGGHDPEAGGGGRMWNWLRHKHPIAYEIIQWGILLLALLALIGDCFFKG